MAYRCEAGKLWTEKVGSDFLIKVGDKRYEVHKSILRVFSRYFRDLFDASGNFVELRTSCVDLTKSVSAIALEHILELLYTQSTDFRDPLVLIGILEAALYLQMKHVVIVCIHRLHSLDRTYPRENFKKVLKLLKNTHMREWLESLIFIDTESDILLAEEEPEDATIHLALEMTAFAYLDLFGLGLDLTIKVEGYSFKVHRCVLSATSAKFRRMSSKTNPKLIDLSEFPAQAVLSIMDLIYSDHDRGLKTKSLLIDRWLVAGFMEMQMVQEYYSSILESHLPENWLPILAQRLKGYIGPPKEPRFLLEKMCLDIDQYSGGDSQQMTNCLKQIFVTRHYVRFQPNVSSVNIDTS